MAAARDGFRESTANVEVAAPKTYRVELLLAAEYPPAPEAKASAPAGAAPAAAITEELAALKDRIEQLEAALAGRPAPESPRGPERRQARRRLSRLPRRGAGADAGPGPAGHSGSPAGPRRHSRGGQLHAVRVRRLYLAQRHAAQQRHGAGHEILHPGSSLRHALHGGFQSADRSHHRGGDRVVPLRRSSRWSRSASAATSTGKTFAAGSCTWTDCLPPLRRATTPAPECGQWDLRDAYKYVSEAYGGYHFNVNHGLNVDAGIFVSYIGLFSYYNFDNWTYQPSYVSSNTPWFFNGLRIQWFPTNKLKIEPWFINGWQSYAKFNGHQGLGGQISVSPERVVLAGLQQLRQWHGQPGHSRPLAYPHRRQHRGQILQQAREAKGISKMAFSLTGRRGMRIWRRA